MDDKKKLIALVGVIVIALAAVGMMMAKNVGGEGPEKKAGSLEEGINHETGLPLNPPSPNAAGGDPSLPNGK
ncbi:MAG: hypothetical protein IT205_04925 [Fimbriimonadaceae bacterium]|nr:hypothetical protein [Fimbriimonadaceae bacterium]MCC7102117.1 hypothetical protein [Fimbriimonadaceae bacterium]